MSFLTLALAAVALSVVLQRLMLGARQEARREFARRAAIFPGEYEMLLERREPFDPAAAFFSLLAVAAALAVHRWVPWGWLSFGGAGLLLILGIYSLTSNLERLKCPAWLGHSARVVAVLLAAGGAVFSGALELRAWSLARAREAAERVAEESFSSERRSWSPPWGVSEGSSGALSAWLAVTPRVAIDWKHEQEQEKKARAERTIPVDVVLLNNSFRDLRLGVSADGRFWRAWITAEGAERALVEWSSPSGQMSDRMLPVQRSDFPCDWDGRDAAGNLLPPGKYVAHLETTAPVPGGESIRLAVTFSIDEEGPREAPATAYPRQILESQRLLNQMQQNCLMFQRMQFDMMRLQR